MGHIARHIAIPHPPMRLGLRQPRRIGPMPGQFRPQRQKAQLGIADHRQGLMLRCILPPGVQTDQTGIWGKDGPRPGGKVLQASAHGQNHIRGTRHRIGAVRPGHAQGANVQWIIGQQVRPPRNGFHHRNAMRLGKGRQLGHRTRILYPTARHDHRTLGPPQQRRRLGNLQGIGRLAANTVEAAGKEGGGIVISPALQILRQADKGRPTIGGVQHRGQSGRQGLQDLRGMRDAVPIAADSFEGVIHAEGRVPEMLQLLQHRIGQARQEGITAQQ